MDWRKLRKMFGGDRKTVDEQFEVILNELEDSEDKLFVWQFPMWDDDKLQEFYEETLEPLLVDRFRSEHILISENVNIDEINIDGENPIKVRDSVYKYVKEEE